MSIRHVNAAVTADEYEQLKKLKGNLTWPEFLTSLAGERFERKADSRGRVKLPDEYADREVSLLVGELPNGNE